MFLRTGLLVTALALLTACTTANGPTAPSVTINTHNGGPLTWTTGTASWYGTGARTANGERYRPDGITAAHRTLPFGTRVLVERVDTGESVVVRINDRGPFIKGRIIDLSRGAARKLGILEKGVTEVRITALNDPIRSSSQEASSSTN